MSFNVVDVSGAAYQQEHDRKVRPLLSNLPL